ncbi:MAG: thymidine kinase [Bacilli bacterium]
MSLYFYYSSMNAGKSTHLLQASYNYQERGMKTILLTAAIDNRFETSQITSRVGLSAPALTYDETTDIVDLVMNGDYIVPADCIMVDEAQFLSREQVLQLAKIVDTYNVPVLCYGLRTDFKGELFEGSAALLALADKLIELKGMCHCGKKATMVIRCDSNGKMILDAPQIEIGNNDKYVSVCRKHYMLTKLDRLKEIECQK